MAVTKIHRFTTFSLSPETCSDHIQTTPKPAGPLSRMQRIADDDDDEETLQNLKTPRDINIHFRRKMMPPPGGDKSVEWLTKCNKQLKSQLALYKEIHRKTASRLTRQVRNLKKKQLPKQTHRATRSVQTLSKYDPKTELVNTKRCNEELQKRMDSLGSTVRKYQKQVDQLQRMLDKKEKRHCDTVSALEKKIHELEAALQGQRESVVANTFGGRMQKREKDYSGFLQYMAEPTHNFN